MAQRLILAILVATVGTLARSDDQPADSMPSYPIKIDASQAREFTTLDIDFANLKLHGDAITVMPISIEPGITGAVLLGNGTYSYSPEPGKNYDGHFRAAILRFNPKDSDTIIKLNDGKAIVDKGAGALSQALMATTFRHCYHNGDDALVPSENSIAVDLFSQELGDVLISVDDKKIVVYNFTYRQKLYEKK
jgi:hypothetical protein